MAWLGVVADAASLVVPCVSGGGALVRAFTKADDVVDAAKALDNVGEAIETTHNLAKTVNGVENTISASSNGFKYTDKVLKQMENTADLNHSFPRIIDSFADVNAGRPLKGNDGITRNMIELPGSINGKSGVFEYIIEPNGMCNHRYFRKFK